MNKLETMIQKYLSAEDAKKISAAKRQFIALELTDDKTTNICSKVGGVGYLPKSVKYPTNTDGKPLSFLAQINFAEMPKLSPFPEQGILAFYIDIFDDLMGLNLDDPKDHSGYQVFYFADSSEPSQDLTGIFEPYKNEELYEVVENEKRLSGTLSEIIPMGDFVEFTQSVGKDFYGMMEDNLSDQQIDDLMDMVPIESAIGGYPFFTQTDPREYDQGLANNYNTLLFQLVSDDDNVMWGDSGVANFFINQEKLQNLDFSDVMYNWDCY
ncbi:YwqG family protein [Xylocopilactobacillus apicola]|uniref:DUF1963 domain-containing protein n=1 Tax=Xylocopilactobacillus apicola TaxID=2932184 RepID=A0AAU9DDY9_9LACO|nr:YwqG family protein [Xylocopilactobacillus apicola]BDR58050.1 hypothetical protein XA3_04910 [Xylocopilactobacillus apicola]